MRERHRAESADVFRLLRAADANRAANIAALEPLAVKSCPRYARDRDRIPTVLLDSSTTVLTNLPKWRISRYQYHLYKVIGEAFSNTATLDEGESSGEGIPGVSSDSAASPRDSLLRQLCTVCAGRCCHSGGEKAYLTATTIARVRGQNPGIRPREVFARYMAALGNKTVAGSCINHSTDGCSLSREMRADICNEYYCPALEPATREGDIHENPVSAVLLISRKSCDQKADSGPETTLYLVEPDTRERVARGVDAVATDAY